MSSTHKNAHFKQRALMTRLIFPKISKPMKIKETKPGENNYKIEIKVKLKNQFNGFI